MKKTNSFLKDLGWNVLPLLVCLAIVRFLPSLLLPGLSKIAKDVSEIRESVTDIKKRVGEIEPLEIKIKKEGAKKAIAIRGTVQIVVGEGMFGYICKRLSNVFKTGARVKVANLEVQGDPSITVVIRGTFEPQEKNVIMQLSEESAKQVKFSREKGITSVEIWSVDE